MADHGEIENLERRVADLEAANRRLRRRLDALSEILRLVVEQGVIDVQQLPDEAKAGTTSEGDGLEQWEQAVEHVMGFVAARKSGGSARS